MVGSGWLKANCLLRFPWVLALLGNVTLSSTVVASLVPRGLGTFGRDVTHLSTVEAAAILSAGLVDSRPIFTFQPRIFAVPGNMTSLKRSKSDKNK
jgi:hypothetical protein